MAFLLLIQQKEATMKTAEMMFRDRPPSRLRQLNWPFLTFWVMYISVMLGIGYTLL